jgi:hypothetical protein
MISNILKVAIVSAGVVAASVPSFAGSNNALDNGVVVQESQAPVTGTSSKAIAAYYYSRGFAAPRFKNVNGFTHPSTGVFCIHSSVATGKIYPMVSVEWNESLGNSLLAYWKVGATDCPSGWFEVTTYAFNSGGPATLSDQVAFDWQID